MVNHLSAMYSLCNHFVFTGNINTEGVREPVSSKEEPTHARTHTGWDHISMALKLSGFSI